MSQKNHLHWLFNHQKVLVDSRSILTVQSRNLFQIVHWVTLRKPLVTGFHTYLHRSPAVDRGMWLRGMYSLQVPFAAFLLPFCGQTNFECLYYIPLWRNSYNSFPSFWGFLRQSYVSHSDWYSLWAGEQRCVSFLGVSSLIWNKTLASWMR